MRIVLPSYYTGLVDEVIMALSCVAYFLIIRFVL